MIKEKTPENIEERQTREKFIQFIFGGESGRITEKLIETFVHQQGHIFTKQAVIYCL